MPASAQVAAPVQPAQPTAQQPPAQQTSVQQASPPTSSADRASDSAAASTASIDPLMQKRVVLNGVATAHVSHAQHARAERVYLRGARQLESREYAEAIDSFANAVSMDPLRQE